MNKNPRKPAYELICRMCQTRRTGRTRQTMFLTTHRQARRGQATSANVGSRVPDGVCRGAAQEGSPGASAHGENRASTGVCRGATPENGRSPGNGVFSSVAPRLLASPGFLSPWAEATRLPAFHRSAIRNLPFVFRLSAFFRSSDLRISNFWLNNSPLSNSFTPLPCLLN